MDKRIDLVATDLDMTLLNQDFAVTPAVKKMAHRLIDSGRQLVIATGRMYKGAVNVAKELELDVPIICYNGAVIKKGLSGELMYKAPMDKDIAAAAIKRGEELGLIVHVYVDDDYYTKAPNPQSEAYQLANGVDVKYHEDLIELLTQGDVMKVLTIGDLKTRQLLLAEMNERFSGRFTATQSHNQYMDFLAPGINKGAALLRLLPLLAVRAENTLGIGDNINDLGLLQTVGVGNAVPELKEKAVFVSRSYTEDGWAYAMEKLVFGE
jgi:Cof subfamily protein (haloacid dehalogenase superfamily)